jgi:uncharacterized protein (DUF488 family)
MVVSTLGYQGLNLSAFIDLLKQNGIQVLVDVRENPISRKKGFSKNALDKAVNENNIKYLHFPALGSPRKIRKEYHDTCDWGEFSRRYSDYLETQQDAIHRLSDVVKNECCCLMCFESDYQFCHRSILTEFLKKDMECDAEIKHLSSAQIVLPALQ